MEKLNTKELLDINGGSIVDTTLIISIINSASTLYDMGRSVGSSVRKLIQVIAY